MDPTDIPSFRDSALFALSSITPPSPILSAIGVSCSSDSIPILFSFDAAEEPTPSSPISLCTIGSVGTFGPLHRQSSHSDATQCPSPYSSTFPPSSDPSWPALSNSTSSIATPRASPNLSTSPSTGSQTRSALTAIPNIQASQTMSNLLTTSSTSMAHLSPSPSIISCPSSPRLRRKFKFPIDCNGPTLSTSKSWVPVLEARRENRDPVRAEHRLSVPESQRLVSQDIRSIGQASIQCSSDHPQPDAIPIPKHLLWLKNTVVELLVDQEGFRSIRPSFKLVGFPKQVRGWDSSHGELALFRPVVRKTFRFHYAPFDSDLPIIRRLTINGDESRDFLSRQAYLSLKTNGVYTVQGAEASHLPSSSFEYGDMKLKWRFEYLVEDLYHESGRIVDGEKSLTPISFLCSPYLLHPSQARKMKFMHIVKKSVTTKLVAEKLEPPSRFGPPAPVKRASNNLWTLHRRVQSTHVHVEETKPRKKTGSLRRAGEHSETKTRRDENQVGRRRRASSAGEERCPIPSQASPHPVQNPLSRHILPRAQLAELLNTEPCDLQGLRPAPRRT
ncbi:hypothetical protein B0H12DRAFT_1140948 [Mycena haematopus]|nr:hypothetical protein B0H12DRAFT_1140948 [Mycena haematopus]